jgi:hypothetical protein
MIFLVWIVCWNINRGYENCGKKPGIQRVKQQSIGSQNQSGEWPEKKALEWWETKISNATPASSYRHLQPATTGLLQRRRSYENAPFQGHNIRLQQPALLGAATPALFSDIISVTNTCYSISWVSQWIPTSHIGDPDCEHLHPHYHKRME